MMSPLLDHNSMKTRHMSFFFPTASCHGAGLSKVSQKEKAKNHMIPLICGIRTESNTELIDTDNSMVLTRGNQGWGR